MEKKTSDKSETLELNDLFDVVPKKSFEESREVVKNDFAIIKFNDNKY